MQQKITQQILERKRKRRRMEEEAAVMRILTIHKIKLPFRCDQESFYHYTLREKDPDFCAAFSLGRFTKTLNRLHNKWCAAQARKKKREELERTESATKRAIKEATKNES